MEEKILNCAIYTRKSHDDGSLEEEFNSLDAQREAAENFIASQKANGWKVSPQRYDDGGFSGGNMERPALKRLLNDVKAGKIDIICIYKMDRLSRSLLDFMKLAEMLEQHNVSFVSVTQDINTSTSAGRMMLNILITFAEFERDLCTERIRLKIEGAKKRGKFCGGTPVLGYDADSEKKKLFINHDEAKVVKLIFARYIELGSARDVARELNKKGLKTKKWKSKRDKIHGGGDFTPDSIYRTLSNPLYIGLVRHHDRNYPGEHEGIVDKELWDKVQDFIAKNRKAHGYIKKEIESPFKGLLKCGYCGGSLGITYTKKKARRYTYYICIKNIDTAARDCPLTRLPAGEADKMIMAQLSSIIKTPLLLARVYEEGKAKDAEKETELLKRREELQKQREKIRTRIAGEPEEKISGFVEDFRRVENELVFLEAELKKFNINGLGIREINGAFESLDTLWDELFPAERYRLAHLLIEKIVVMKDSLKIEIKTHGISSLVQELQVKDPEKFRTPDGKGQIISLEVPIAVKHKYGRRMIIMPENEERNGESPVQETLLQALARAHSWIGLIEKGEVATLSQLADSLNLDLSYVGKIFRMINLAPDIQEAIIEGKEPDGLSLARLRGIIPADWEEQKRLFRMIK